MAVIRAPIAAIQAAIFDAIRAANPARSVWAYPPNTNPPRPYVYLGDMVGQQDDTKTDRGSRVDYTVGIVSESTGTTELNEIMDEVLGAVTGADLDLTANDWTLVSMEATWTASTEMSEPNLIQHGVIKLSIYVNDTLSQ
jgi:hypothetical protein